MYSDGLRHPFFDNVALFVVSERFNLDEEDDIDTDDPTISAFGAVVFIIVPEESDTCEKENAEGILEELHDEASSASLFEYVGNCISTSKPTSP